MNGQDLPSDLTHHRIPDSKQAALFWGVSLDHWRRLYRTGKVPIPIRLSERKLGWRVADLIDGLAARATRTPCA